MFDITENTTVELLWQVKQVNIKAFSKWKVWLPRHLAVDPVPMARDRWILHVSSFICSFQFKWDSMCLIVVWTAYQLQCCIWHSDSFIYILVMIQMGSHIKVYFWCPKLVGLCFLYDFIGLLIFCVYGQEFVCLLSDEN